jgi:uncharacterized RDD family membrane protein YckC
MSIDSENLPKVPLTEWLMDIFLKLVALACLFMGVQYWAMLVGFSMGGAGRFDLAGLPWKTAGTALAVLYPVAAVGLWLRASWGPVIWVVIAATELAMHEVWGPVFGANRLLSATIVIIMACYVGLRIAIVAERRRTSAPR